MASLRPSWGRVTHQFPYHDASDIRVFSRFRVEITEDNHSAGPKGDKTFWYCAHYDRTNPAHVSLPYGLPRLLEGIANGAVIHLVEGESDAEAIWDKLKLYATTSHLGTRFPLEVAEHFTGALNTTARVVIWADRDHTVQKHIDAFNHKDESKRRDYPGAAAALRKWRALRKLGISCGVREVVVGKDVRDQIDKRQSLDSCKRLSGKPEFLDILKGRCPREALSKRSVTLKLSTKDLPEGPALRRLIEAAESKGYILERIGENRYKTNCPNPDHTDSNPSFEFEQGDGKAVGFCFGCECDVEVWAGGLDLKKSDLFDSKKGSSPDKPDDSGYCPDAADPMEVAKHIEDEWISEDGTVCIMCCDDETWLWSGTHWTTAPDSRLRHRLYQRMNDEMQLKLMTIDGKPSWVPVRWAPTSGKIGNLIEAVKATNSHKEMPKPNSWLSGEALSGPLLPMANGIYAMATGSIHPVTARLFNTWSVPYAYDAAAQCPVWMEFLESVFQKDDEAILALQVWFAYLLSGRIDLEQGLMIIGPSRSGKGVILWVAEQLLGADATASLRLSDLPKDFGLEKLLNKPLTVIPDNKAKALRSDKLHAAVENLLSVISNDKLAINRKNRQEMSTRLNTRVMMATNDIQHFDDGSGAINKRWVVLSTRKSFADNPDETLKERLAQEVQGILNWALGGLPELKRRGKLIQPASGQRHKDLLDAETPQAAFVSRRMELGEDFRFDGDELWLAWVPFAHDQGLKSAGNKNRLVGDLNPVFERLGAIITREREEKPNAEGKRPYYYKGARLIPNESGMNLKNDNGQRTTSRMRSVKEKV
ncbi:MULTISPECIES: phage/plasmid primase, P4 family [unclassified Streptomyces]|uniref:phage/plasmid primase, P4 family n=1 Tax=unclassified Streptomyces TaxID=2593676 RepID=UPI0036E05D6E